MIALNHRQLLDKCLDDTDLALRQLMDLYFDHLDDELFARAEQAPSNSSQQMYFDAMRQLYLKRQGVAGRFLENANRGCKQFLEGQTVPLPEANAAVDPASEPQALELLPNALLEEDLAIKRVLTRNALAYAASLEALTNMFSALVGRHISDELENPVGPARLLRHFQDALSFWQGDAEVRLFLYELFGKYVLAALGQHYKAMLGVLVEAGIQPLARQKPEVHHHEAPGQAVHQPVFAPSADPLPDGEGEANLLSLVSLLRELIISNRDQAGLPPVYSTQDPRQPVLRSRDISATLGTIQAGVLPVSPFDYQAALAQNEWLKHEMGERLGEVASSQQKSVHVLDQHIMDVLLLMFDFVLEDPLLPTPMKVLLSRLQIPFMRTALADRSFLIDREHPARQLLNTLSRSAIRWSDTTDVGGDRGMLEAIEGAVGEVLGFQGVPDRSLYASVHQQFSEWLLNYERGARISEERLGQVARGQEQLTHARMRVDEALSGYLKGRIPLAVYRILDGPWRDVLTLDFLRHSEGSAEWRHALQVVERLVESVSPRLHEIERQQAMRTIPLVLGELREGFASVSYDAGKTAALFKELQLCHIMALRGLQPEPSPFYASDSDSSLKVAAEVPDEYDQLAESLRAGQWINWALEGHELRAKLAWRSEIADVLLFVDMRGRKVAEMTAHDLADLFRSDKATILREITVPLMDRALAAVYGLLRKILGKKAETLTA